MEKQQFRKLQTGDLIQWNHIPASDPNILGVVVAHSSRIISMSSSVPFRRQVKLYQIRVNWGSFKQWCFFAEDDSVIAQLELIAGAKK